MAALMCTYCIHTSIKNTNNLQITTHTVQVDLFSKETEILYSTAAHLICTEFYVYFQKTAQSTPLKTLYNVKWAAVFEVLPQKVSSFALWRHLDAKTARIFENGTVVEKRGPLSWEKVIWFQTDSSNWARSFKKCQTMCFHANTTKNAKLWRKCQIPFFMPNHFKKGQISVICP